MLKTAAGSGENNLYTMVCLHSASHLHTNMLQTDPAHCVPSSTDGCTQTDKNNLMTIDRYHGVSRQ